MDVVLSFLLGVLSSWIFLFGVFFLAILAETKENLGWSIFLGILTVVSLYFVFGFTSIGLPWWGVASIYAAGGMIHALWRWFRSTSIITDRFNQSIDDLSVGSRQSAIRQYKRDTDYRDNMDKITYWIIAWPISGAAHFLGDVVNTVQQVVTKFFSGVFDSITERARGKVKVDLSGHEFASLFLGIKCNERRVFFDLQGGGRPVLGDES